MINLSPMPASPFLPLKMFAVVVFALVLAVFGSLLYFKQQTVKLISPIFSSELKIADNVWFPKSGSFSFPTALASTKLTAEAAFFVDAQTGEVLFEKNAHKKLPIASLTKIMTVITALDKKDFSDTFDVSRRAAEIEPDKMLLKPFEKLTMEELLDGIFLVSANDAAEVLAEKTYNNRDKFINLMNLKAKSLGMADSLFINPTGLEEDDPSISSGSSGQGKQQYSTAYDVALMSRYAIYRYPHLLDISSNPHIIIPQTETHQDYDLYSGINLLTTYPGVIGFKTGYTPEANLTLVTVAQKGDKRVLGVILGATDRRDDAKTLLDYSFKRLGVK